MSPEAPAWVVLRRGRVSPEPGETSAMVARRRASMERRTHLDAEPQLVQVALAHTSPSQTQNVESENTTGQHDHRQPEEVKPKRQSHRQREDPEKDRSLFVECDLCRAIRHPPESVLLPDRAGRELSPPEDQGETAYCGHDSKDEVIHSLVIRHQKGVGGDGGEVEGGDLDASVEWEKGAECVGLRAGITVVSVEDYAGLISPSHGCGGTAWLG
jgi:hypothetical protein